MLGAPQKQNDRTARAVGVAAPAARSTDLFWRLMAWTAESLPQAGSSQRPLPALGKESCAQQAGMDMGIPQHHSLCSILPLLPAITGQSDSHVQPKLPCYSACVEVSLSCCCLLFPRALQALPNLKKICQQDTSHRKGAFQLAEKQIRRIHILQWRKGQSGDATQIRHWGIQAQSQGSTGPAQH